MKKYLLTIMFCLNFSAFGQNCSMLKNGKYETLYDGRDNYSDPFEIKENNYILYQNRVNKDYKIRMLGNCSFQIENIEKVDESKLTEFQKILNKQKPYFEITKVEGNVYYFVCRINLHIQCGSGKFVGKPD